MRWLIAGAGAVGGAIGGELADHGALVTFLARGRTLEALRTDGLHIHEPDRSFHLPPDGIRAIEHVSDLREPVDAVIFCVKAYDAKACAESLRPIARAGLRILCLQNGVSGPDRLSARLEPSTILGGRIHINADRQPPNEVSVGTLRNIRFGRWDGQNPNNEDRDVAAELKAAGFECEIAPDAKRVLWEKMVPLASYSAVTSLTRQPIGSALACAETRALLSESMKEAAAVAKAEGIDLGGRQHIEQLMQWLATLPADGRSSMWSDMEANRPIEVDELSGAIVRLGRKSGVPTPCHATFLALLTPHDRTIRASTG